MEHLREIELWSRYHAVGLMLALITYLNTNQLWILPVVSFVSFGYLLLTKRKLLLSAEYKMSRANMVTLGRHDLLMILVIISTQIHHFYIGIIASIVALMDLLDGYYARKDQNSSLLGEYLDKEVDAIFILMMGAMIYHFQLLPSWILMVGILRFIYVLILPFIKSPNKKEYKSRYGRVIAVTLMVGMIGCFFIKYEFYKFIMIGISILVVSSFLRALFHWAKNTASSS